MFTPIFLFYLYYTAVSIIVVWWIMSSDLLIPLSSEPTTVDLRVDGLTDICTKEQDINFFFTGFSVLGTVRHKPT